MAPESLEDLGFTPENTLESENLVNNIFLNKIKIRKKKNYLRNS